jgi:hypothetical protein
MSKARNVQRPNETGLQRRSRDAREADLREQSSRPLVSDYMAQHGDYRQISTVGEARLARRNHATTQVAKWFAAGSFGFELPQERAWEYLEGVWVRAATPDNQCASYAERFGGGFEGMNHFEAIRTTAAWQEYFGATYWSIAEDMLRWGKTSAEIPYSFAGNRSQQDASVKAVVGLVLSKVAERNHLPPRGSRA